MLEVAVKEGQQVEVGALIAKIDARELEAQLGQAQAAAAAAKAQIDAMDAQTRAAGRSVAQARIGAEVVQGTTAHESHRATESVLLRRERWRAITLWSALGASIGALVLYLVFHHLGWNQLVQWYPDIAASKSWRDATAWVTRYGAWALFVIAATPLPQTPALAFAAIARMPVPEVLVALLTGKLIKYGIYAWLVARCPDHFERYLRSNSFARP